VEGNQAASARESNGIETHSNFDKIRSERSMKKLMNGTFFCTLLFVTAVFSAAVSAQGPYQSPPPAKAMADVQPPNPKGSDPKPEDAIKAILSAFDKYQVVGMGAAHRNKNLDDFILDLVRNPALPSKINDVAVECGNALYQPILDRYIAGDDVPLAEVRQVWRNTTQPMCGVSAFYEELFPLVRKINQELPPAKRLRVLAADPPIDWSKVKSRDDLGQFMNRDVNIASVMQKEVLSKHRKALMLFGTAHLYHGDSRMGLTAVGLYERDYPGVTLVIGDHVGFGNWSPLAKYNDEFEARIASWPVPSLVPEMTGTWLADLLDMTYSSGAVIVTKDAGGKLSESQEGVLTGFSKMVDAYLYLGPRDLLLKEPRPAEIFLNKEYMAEMHRRAVIMGEDPITDQANPEKVSDRDYNPFFYDPEEYRRITQPLPSATPPSSPQP
jgi:hypothetical protein